MPKRNTLLKYIPKDFPKETIINPQRIFEFNEKPIKDGFVVYFCEREMREEDNFALQFARQKSKEFNLPLKILYQKLKFDYEPKKNFIENEIEKVKKHLEFEVVENIFEYLSNLDVSILITDFNPISDREKFYDFDFKIYEIDGHNIVPARFVSDKQEYNAFTFRNKIYYKIAPFLSEYETESHRKYQVLEDFIETKLPYYEEYKNNPCKNVLSGLSKYLNLGFISAQRVALEVLKSDVSENNKEVFLEELVIRRELSDNFCLYCRNYKTFDCISDWAKKSLENHKSDIRSYVYSLEEFEQAKTHDNLWNATQIQLVREGIIHGYLRMYWAKKILEWSNSPDDALKIAIYLNDKYAYDSPSPSGYVNILWSIAGLHDRAFQDWFVTGKIRRMTYNSIKRKYPNILI